MSKNKTITIQGVNARVEELAAEFRKGMQDFRDLYLENRAPSTSSTNTETNNDSFLSKFELFESTITVSLNNLRSEVKKLKQEMVTLSMEINKTESIRNQNFLIIHGVQESTTSDLYSEILQIFINKNKVEISKRDIKQCYRMGKKVVQQKRPRPIAVEFCQRWIRDLVFYTKKNLKGSRIMFTEMLTLDNLKIYKQVRLLMGNAAWSYGGLVYVQCEDGRKLIKSEEDMEGLQRA